MEFSKNDKERIASIRKSLVKFKKAGVDMSTWESPFLLNIIDKLLKEK